MSAPMIPLLRLVESKRLASPRHVAPSRFARRAAVLIVAIPLALVLSVLSALL